MTVIGTGYLGATHAACMAELGHEVLGVDVDEDKLKALKNDMAQQLIDDFLNEMYQMNMPKEKLMELIDERWKK